MMLDPMTRREIEKMTAATLHDAGTPVETAIRMAQRGQVTNAHAVQRPNGEHYLRSNPDGKIGNNLDALAGDI